MSTKIILVNGVPASGKSTVAKLIASHIGAAYLSVDTFKEPFMNIYTALDRDFNRELGKAAYQALWNTVKDNSGIFVIDAWFGFQPKEILEEYLSEVSPCTVLEIWNNIDSDNVVKRYKVRIPLRDHRHPKEEYLPQLRKLNDSAEPMGIGLTYIVDQNKPLDNNSITSWIDENI
ncbi:AAA family ATPase [Vibrio sp. DW001]|uniref:AAA family ATPase n=1 Tax=Vibrio sp. DW001 TaxID=2912315 RepID=UPI0023AEB244|nr:AAA family ATPase [Vibrio sp. DW001]WED25941.1 AAA family ATPase [Vibrio sp. DW001]